MDAIFYGFAVLLFAAVILAIEGIYLWWTGTHGTEARRIARRLRLMSTGENGRDETISILKQRPYSRHPWFDAFLHKQRLAHALDRKLLQAGARWSVAQFLGASLAAFVVALLLLQTRPVPLLAQCVVLIMFTHVPYVLLLRARKARLIKIEQQLPEAADFLSRAMRAGHSFGNVMQMVGNELPEPLSGEFRATHQEINYGVPLNEALYNLAERIPLTDLRYLVIAVVIQRESGGNLAEILSSISYIIRERLKLIGKVRVLSAEGRMSAWILGLLPFCALAFMSVANPNYISVLWTDPFGIQMLWCSAGLIVIGVFWIRRVVHIHV
ncbi:MAG: type II secretion system F family protein [Gammaproteobacteria bacterium]